MGTSTGLSPKATTSPCEQHPALYVAEPGFYPRNGRQKYGTDFSGDIIAIARDIIQRKWLQEAVCKLAKGGLKRGQSGSFGQNDQQKQQQRAIYCGRFPEA
jgi:hypothetical protein